MAIILRNFSFRQIPAVEGTKSELNLLDCYQIDWALLSEQPVFLWAWNHFNEIHTAQHDVLILFSFKIEFQLKNAARTVEYRPY